MKLFLSLVCAFSLCAQAPYHLTYLGQRLAINNYDVDRMVDEHNAHFKNLASKIRKPA